METSSIDRSFLKPEVWYQIKAVGLNKEELLLWRTADAEPDSRAFATFIQHQISMREIPAPTEKEIITKEVVMVKCEYCGFLIPQTAVFCPNCGAKRTT